MTSLTQTIVGKGIPIPLIAENWLKILRDSVPPSPPKSLTNSLPWNDRTTINLHFPSEMITELNCQVNILTSYSPILTKPVRLTLNL